LIAAENDPTMLAAEQDRIDVEAGEQLKQLLDGRPTESTAEVASRREFCEANAGEFHQELLGEEFCIRKGFLGLSCKDR